MDETTRLTETLSPAERRTRLRAYADRMLRLLGASDDPEDGEGVLRGMRAVVMIERIYARCDAAEGAEPKRAVQAFDDRVALETKKRWATQRLERPFVLPTGETLRPPATLRDALAADGKAELSEEGSPYAEVDFRPVPAEILRQIAAETNAGTGDRSRGSAAMPETPAVAALRRRLATVGADDHSQDLIWHQRRYGLMRPEAFEALCGADIFTRLRGMGYRRGDVVRTLSALSAEDIRWLWPGWFAAADTS